MSESDSDFDLSSESARLMDGHVEANAGEVRGSVDNSRKRRPKHTAAGDYGEVSSRCKYKFLLN